MSRDLKKEVVNLAEFEVLSRTPYAWVNAARKLVESTFVVFRDAEGRVGTILIEKAKPTLDDVKKAVAERAKGRA